MKTLHLTNSWHQTSGGIATFYRALIEEANRRKHEIRLVVPGETDRVEEVGPCGRIYYIQSASARLNPEYRTIYPGQYLKSGSRLQGILSSERPDLVEICDKYTLHYLGALLRMQLLPALDFRPVVVGLSCERMDDNFRSYLGPVPLFKKFCATYMRWLYFPFFDHHIANSEYTAAELRPAAQGQVVSRGTWIQPMGVDLRLLSPLRRSNDGRRSLLREFGAPPGAILLLYAGRLVPEKNLSLLFGLMEHLSQNSRRDFRLLVVGDGIERTSWEKEVSSKIPSRVRFLSYISDKNVLADIYANCDIFVHPNPKEPFGIAPLEAMASGLPLVAPNEGGVTSYANCENAWTVPPTVEHFAKAIEEVLRDVTRTNKKTVKAVVTANEYSWEKVAALFLDLYVRLFRNFRTAQQTELAPAFQTTPAKGLRATAFHVISQSANKTFRFISKRFLTEKSRPQLACTNTHRQAHPPSIQETHLPTSSLRMSDHQVDRP